MIDKHGVVYLTQKSMVKLKQKYKPQVSIPIAMRWLSMDAIHRIVHLNQKTKGDTETHM